MDCSLPGSSIHGIFQARVLEWVAISFSKGFKSLFHLLKNCPCRAGSFTAQENYLKPSLPSSPVPSRRVSELFSLFSHLSLFAFPFASISCLSTSDPWSFLLLQSRWWMYMPQVFSAPLQSCLFLLSPTINWFAFSPVLCGWNHTASVTHMHHALSVLSPSTVLPLPCFLPL